MCESCQRPASNGIIVPRDSGPLTTSALEKSQKQTAQCKQEQPEAAVPGQSSQQRPRPQRPGRSRRPDARSNEPPRRAGTVGASLSPSSIAWAPGSQLLFCQPRNLAKGLRMCRKAVPVGLRSRALSCSDFQAHEMQSGTHFELWLPGNVWVCKYVSRFWKPSR